MTTTLSSPADDAARYAWAEHLIWMEGGEPVPAGERERVAPGVFFSVVVAGIAIALAWIVSQSGSSKAGLFDPIVLSMLFGLAMGNLFPGSIWLPGVSFAVRRILPFGILLLGARLDFFAALKIGGPGLGMSLGVILLSLAILVWLGRCLGLDRKLAILLGVGTGICGGSAIVAIAPLLRANDRDVLVSVGLVTLLGLAVMLLLPSLAAILSLSELQSGLLAGLIIHQTPQVIAAGFSIGENAGEVATVAKLSRVCLLAPVAVVLGWWFSRESSQSKRTHSNGLGLIPWFVVGFFLMALVKTFGFLPEVSLRWETVGIEFATAEMLKSISLLCLAMGMVGVGFQTRISEARSVGWRPFLAALLATLFITAVAVAAIWTFFPSDP